MVIKSIEDLPFEQQDPWYEVIGHLTTDYAIKKTTTAEMAALMEIGEPSRSDQIRIGTELQRLGFRHVRVRRGKRLVWEYHDTGRPPPSLNPVEEEGAVHMSRSYPLLRSEALKLLKKKPKSGFRRRVPIS